MRYRLIVLANFLVSPMGIMMRISDDDAIRQYREAIERGHSERMNISQLAMLCASLDRIGMGKRAAAEFDISDGTLTRARRVFRDAEPEWSGSVKTPDRFPALRVSNLQKAAVA